MFGCSRLGAVVTCSSPEYGVEEASYIAEASSSKLIFADKGSLKTLKTVADRLGISYDRVLTIDSNPGHTSIQDLISHGQSLRSQVPFWKIPSGQSNKDTLAYLSFTSGTTSKPKGVSKYQINHFLVLTLF